MIRLLLKLRRYIDGSLELIVGLCARDTRMNEGNYALIQCSCVRITNVVIS